MADLEAFRSLIGTVGRIAREKGVRLGVIGGAGSLLVAEGGPKFVDTPEFPQEFAEEPRVLDAVLQDLRESDQDLDWFFLSPAAGFGSYAPGERTGSYRLGGDVLLTDENGESHISGADLAIALVDEIETPAHRRTRFTVAY
jgi:putative NADH-flavin reductase